MSRNVSIDIVKFFAVILVMNSHMEICYPSYKMLSTGGAIGDALFFFASGFTLFLGQTMRFDNWYKRRINRIYPSILAAAIIAYVFWGFDENIGDILIGRRYWFIGCIMIYYLIIYPIKEVGNGKFAPICLIVWAILCIIVYFCFFNDGSSFYGGGLFRCFVFFLIMLQGAIMGQHSNEYSFKYRYIPLFLLSVITWYALCFFAKDSWALLFSFIPLMGVTRYLYLCCNSSLFKKLYSSKIVGNIIYIISHLCLDVYLIQKFVFTDQLNQLFPLNIPIIMLCVIGIAYFVKLLANFISQTLRKEPYEWNKIFPYK